MAVIRDKVMFTPNSGTVQKTLYYRVRLLPSNKIIHYGQAKSRVYPDETYKDSSGNYYCRCKILLNDLIAPYFGYVDCKTAIDSQSVVYPCDNSYLYFVIEYGWDNTDYQSKTNITVYNYNGEINGYTYDTTYRDVSNFEYWFKGYMGTKPDVLSALFTGGRPKESYWDLMWTNYLNATKDKPKLNLYTLWNWDVDSYIIPITIQNYYTILGNKFSVWCGLKMSNGEEQFFDVSDYLEFDYNTVTHSNILIFRPFDFANIMLTFYNDTGLDISGMRLLFKNDSATDERYYYQLCLPLEFKEVSKYKRYCVPDWQMFWLDNKQCMKVFYLNGTSQFGREYSHKYLDDFYTKKYSTQVQEYITLNTGWITEDEYQILQSVKTAPQVTLWGNYWYTVEDTSTSWEEWKYVNDKKLCNITFRFKLNQKLNYTYG